MKLTFELAEFRFRSQFKTSFTDLKQRTVVNLQLEDEDGLIGYGEAAPLEPYDGVSIEQVIAALKLYQELLKSGHSSAKIPEVLRACRLVADLPQALAAVDIALWDLAAKRSSLPLALLLNPNSKALVEVNAILSGVDPSALAESANLAAKTGYRTLKIKAGFDNDIERLAAVRTAVGHELKLRIDANGAWQPNYALQRLNDLADFDLELCEEPTAGVKQITKLSRLSPVPLAVDESLTKLEELIPGVSSYVCLKVTRCGGVTGTVAAAQRAWRAGITPFIASSFDGPTGTAAGLQLAAALAISPASGLHTLPLLDCTDPFQFKDGALRLTDANGIGITPAV